MILLYILTFIIGTAWDNYAVYNGHWTYSGKETLGIFIGYLPLEDYLFFLLVPYCILVGYKFFEKYFTKQKRT